MGALPPSERRGRAARAPAPRRPLPLGRDFQGGGRDGRSRQSGRRRPCRARRRSGLRQRVGLPLLLGMAAVGDRHRGRQLPQAHADASGDEGECQRGNLAPAPPLSESSDLKSSICLPWAAKPRSERRPSRRRFYSVATRGTVERHFRGFANHTVLTPRYKRRRDGQLSQGLPSEAKRKLGL